MMGDVAKPEWLTTDKVLSLFGILDSGSDRVSVTPFCVNFAIALSYGRTATGNHYAVLVGGDQWRPHSADKIARPTIFLSY